MAAGSILTFLAQRPAGRVALVTHARPDGDALGSAMGLAHLLRAAGHDATVVSPGPIPSTLRFLTDPDCLQPGHDPDWWREFACLGVLDCGDPDRLDAGNRPAAANLPAFTIDHHATSTGIGQACWIDPDASSTGEMVVRLAAAAGWPLTPPAAQALWTAIVSDTGRFSYENATPAALAAGRTCLLAGADPARVAREIFQSVSLGERRLQIRILERLELHAAGRLGLSWLRTEDFAAAGVGREEAQDCINLIRDTAGVEVAIFLCESPSEPDGRPASVKISLRTRSPYNSLDLARRLGGGGHKRAAGCSAPAPLADARQRVLDLAHILYFPETAAGTPPD
ncbi:MAG: bifunctional oligoribonuclease/PAP phosphatase NrnA [Planctomycetes bacterium]|nr:bifunctional oligoribonuclease/PAP phosphatase NrnA [Planctomycetota bacterium]